MINHKPLQIFNASAGSGKTYTLVQEYLRIVLHSKNPLKFRSILAMTFTNKAANEMKERIVEGLIQLSKSANKKTESDWAFLKTTAKNLGLDEDIVELRSNKILNSILHNYSAFSVMTIDKFTHKVIRTFAKDLNISIDFDVELDMEKLRKQVTDLIFDKIGRDGDLTALMLRYANANLSEDKSWNFNGQVMEFSQQLFQEDAHNAIERLRKLKAKDFIDVQESIAKDNAIIKQKIIRNAKEAFDLIKNQQLTADDFVGKSSSVYTLFKRLSEGEIEKGPTATHIKNVNADKWGHPSSANKVTVEGISHQLGQYFNQIQAVYDGEYGTYLLNREILKNLNNLSLLNNLLQLVEEVKAEENVLLISDFYRKIAEVITEEPVPFIYERLGVRYAHFLLDEFQDTSQMQWINTIPLLHNSLASENTNLIVGDGKQAIYRWRNGEVEQFTNLPDKILNPDNIASLNDAEPLFKALGEKKTLKYNFRSAPEVVEFNNAFFTFNKTKLPESLQSIYKDNEQLSTQKFAGYVEGNLTEKISFEEQLVYIHTSVEKALATNYALRDICVLVRTNSTGAEVSRYLTEKGIKVISPDSLFIGKDLTVKFVVNLMSALINPTNKNYKIKTLEHFSNLILDKSPRETIAKYTEVLAFKNIQQLMVDFGYELKLPNQFHNLYEFTESILATFHLNLGANPFLQFLLEQVHLFEKFNNSSLREFIQWYEDRGHRTSIVSPDGANAVQVMTIHKSKGLQFPVVICPFMDWKIELNKEKAWVEQEWNGLPAYFVKMNKNIAQTELAHVFEEQQGKVILDNLNLIYVAFTRAERALFFSGNPNKAVGIAKDYILPFINQTELGKVESNQFTYGDFLPPTSRKHQEVNNYPITFHGKKMDKPVLSFKSAENWDIDDMDEKRLFGTKVHYILSEISGLKDLETTIEKTQRKGKINSDEAKEIKATIETLFDDPHFANYFNIGEQINEQAFINSEGEKLIPDKIILRPTETIIVDFKTGHWAPSHKKQLAAYKEILSELNYQNIRGEIYYTESKKVIEI